MDVSKTDLPVYQNRRLLLQIQSLLKDPQWRSSLENKKLAQQALERSREPFYKYEPYFNRRDERPSWQWQFLAAAENYRGRVALGANRIGKSDQGAYECMLAITGKHPFRSFPAKGKGWVVGLDYNMVRDINLPKFNKFLPRNYSLESDYSKADKIWQIRGEDREWEVQFKSSDSGREKFQGVEVDWIWFDEEPEKTDVFTECMTRLIDRAGSWWMTATPIKGTAWLKALSEREDVFSISGAMWDNPYIPEEEIRRKAADCSEDERLVSVEGIYLVFGGKPVFNIRLLTKLIDQLKDDLPISVGTIASYAA